MNIYYYLAVDRQTRKLISGLAQ